MVRRTWRRPQLGTGVTSVTPSLVPGAQVMNLVDAVQVSTGWNHACALRSNNTVVCWGQGLGGVATSSTPVAVGGVTQALELRTGNTMNMVTRGGGLPPLCWGNDSNAQCGLGSTSFNRAPTAMTNTPNGVMPGPGEGTGCMVEADGSVSCMGLNGDGQAAPGAQVLLPFRVLP